MKETVLAIQYFDRQYIDQFDPYIGMQDVAMHAQSYFNTGPGYFVLKGLSNGRRYELGSILMSSDLHDCDILRLVQIRQCMTCGIHLEIPQTYDEKKASLVRYAKGKFYCTQQCARKAGEFFIPDP